MLEKGGGGGGGGGFQRCFAIISLYAFAGYRLMPALQSIYSSLTLMSFVGSSVDRLYNDITKLNSYNLNNNKNILQLNKKIVLKNICL